MCLVILNLLDGCLQTSVVSVVRPDNGNNLRNQVRNQGNNPSGTHNTGQTTGNRGQELLNPATSKRGFNNGGISQLTINRQTTLTKHLVRHRRSISNLESFTGIRVLNDCPGTVNTLNYPSTNFDRIINRCIKAERRTVSSSTDHLGGKTRVFSRDHNVGVTRVLVSIGWVGEQVAVLTNAVLQVAKGILVLVFAVVG